MKKEYIEPTITVVNLKIESLMTVTSAMTTGDDWNGSGEGQEAGSREGKGFFDE